MPVTRGSHAPPARNGTALQLGETLGEMAVAMAYLELLAAQFHGRALPGELPPAAIPQTTLVAVRRSCQALVGHTGCALAAMSPRRAAQVEEAAAQLRDVELLRHMEPVR